MEREGRASSKTPLLEHGYEKGTVKHPFPMNYFLKPWTLGKWFYQVIKIGIVQYVCYAVNQKFFSLIVLEFLLFVINKIKLFFPWQMLIKTLSAILAVVLEAYGIYCDGEFKWGCG